MVKAKKQTEFFDKWYAWNIRPKYANWFSIFYREHTENPRGLLAKVLSETNRRSVLDVSCGDGDHTLFIKKAGVPIVVGIDLLSQALRLPARALSLQNPENFDRQNSYEKYLPFCQIPVY